MKKKKRERNRIKAASGARGPFFRSLPVSQLTDDERQEFAATIGEHARTELAEALQLVQQVTPRVEPYLAISVMACYALMRFSGSRIRPVTTSDVQQGHVEYLQALFLRTAPQKGAVVATPDDLQVLFDSLPRAFAGQQNARMLTREEMAQPEAPEQSSLRLVQEYLRAHTSVVRNWGYFGSVTRISNELLAGIDGPFKAKFQLAATEVTRLFEHLVRRHESRVSAHWSAVQDVFGHKSVEAIVNAFFERFPFRGEVETFAARLKQDAPSIELLKFALMPWADRFLTGEFFFRSEHIAHELGFEVGAVDSLLRKLSLEPGSLSAMSPDQLFLDNPVWLKPLIRLPNDEFFCALPQTLMSFVYSIVDDLVRPYPALSQKLSDVRAQFLEKDLERMLRAAFPQAEVATQYKWRNEGQEFETDVVLRFDTTLLLVEAKSGKVSWPALRGAPARLIEHVRNLIVAPSEQSGRLAAKLQEEIEVRKQGLPPQLEFPLPLDNVTAVLRLSVSLHDFATVQSVPALLAQAGLLNNKYPLAPCISLADLEVMLDLLEEPHIRLHYVRQRASTLLSQHVMGDELDMLGLYLDTSLSFGGLPPGEQRIFLNGYSERLDRYYTARDEGEHVRKPRRATTAWFNRLCDQISRRPLVGWSELTSALLSLTPHHQHELERRVQGIARRIREGKPLPNNEDTTIFVGPVWVKTALVVRARDPRLPGRFSEGIENVASVAFEQEHVERCCVVVVDALSPELPYLSAALLTRADRDVPATIYF
jgi:hypothetical protein